MTLRATLPFCAAGLFAVAILIVAHLRSVSLSPFPRNADDRDGARIPLQPRRILQSERSEPRAAGLSVGETSSGPHLPPQDSQADRDPMCAAWEEFASRDPVAALSSALAIANQDRRDAAMLAVLRGWGRKDLPAAGAWVLSQPALDRRSAFAALFATPVSDPDEAIRFARRVVLMRIAEAQPCSDALIAALCATGEYAHAARFAADAAAVQASDRLADVYRKWSTQAPEPAWLSASALPDRRLRLTALESTVHAWSQSEPGAAAETARQSPAGPERTMALTMALRAWLERDLDAASEWLLRWEPTGTLASVDIGLVLAE